MPSELLTAEALAAELGPDVTRRHVLDWRLRYGWPCVQVGRKVWFTPEQVAQIIAQHTVTKAAAADPAPVAGQTARSAARGRS